MSDFLNNAVDETFENLENGIDGIVNDATHRIPAPPGASVEEILRIAGTTIGASAYEIACRNGFSGTQSEWLASLIGASAYEVACSNGFTGTEAEWVGPLNGVKELNTGDALKFWIGTKAEYEALEEQMVNCLYLISDDDSRSDIFERLEALEALEALEHRNVVLWEGNIEPGESAEVPLMGNYKVFAFTVNRNADVKVGQRTFIAYRSESEFPPMPLISDSLYRDFAEFGGLHYSIEAQEEAQEVIYNYFGRVTFNEEDKEITFVKGFSTTPPNMTGTGTLYLQKIIGIC